MKRPKSTQGEDELDARFKAYVQGIENRHRHDIEVLENRLAELQGQHQKDIQELKDQLRVSRFHVRSMAYFSMLNTYINILKFAVKDEPDAKKRRVSKRFQNSSVSRSLVLFVKTVYPHRYMNAGEIREYFKCVDSFKGERDQLAHPRHVAELQSEAHRFGEMLETHKQMGDTLDSNETRFLDVFSKIDALCAKGIGNLRV